MKKILLSCILLCSLFTGALITAQNSNQNPAREKTQKELVDSILKSRPVHEEVIIKDESSEEEIRRRELRQKRIDNAVATAAQLYENRSKIRLDVNIPPRQNPRTLLGVRLSGITNLLYNDQLCGVGCEFDLVFDNESVVMRVGNEGRSRFFYKIQGKEVVIYTRFNNYAFRIPYPFPAGYFKANGYTASQYCIQSTPLTMIQTPPIQNSTLSDKVLAEKIKGHTYVGFLYYHEQNHTLYGTSYHPCYFCTLTVYDDGTLTVVTAAKNRYDKVILSNARYYIDRPLNNIYLENGKKCWGRIFNNGDVIDIFGDHSDFYGYLYKIK